MRIYLDYNATAPPAPGVVDTVCRVLGDDFGNPSSVHADGQRARGVLDDARGEVAELLDAAPSDVVLTAGGTESDNLAVRGAAEARWGVGRRHLIASAIEHEAVLNTLKALEHRGWRTTLLPVGASGQVDPAALTAVITAETALVSVMHANNEVGTIQPVADLAAIAQAHGAWFHTDAVQSAGKLAVSVKTLGADLVSISGHKFGGPKGTGALWIRRGVRLSPYLTGGRQERSRRAGTENVAGLAGMGVAARYARETLATAGRVAAGLRDRLEDGVLRAVHGTIVNGDRTHRVPNTTNISFEGIEAESLLIALDLEGIAVSTGSACSSGALEPSHVLRAMGLPTARTRNSLRFSLGSLTTEAEIDVVLARLPALVEKLRRLTRTAASIARSTAGTASPAATETGTAVRKS